jgi:hypothetical protein
MNSHNENIGDQRRDLLEVGRRLARERATDRAPCD